MKWKTSEITAKMMSRWIRKLVTWNKKKPPAQRITRIIANNKNMLSRLSLTPEAPRCVCLPHTESRRNVQCVAWAERIPSRFLRCPEPGNSAGNLRIYKAGLQIGGKLWD